MIDSFREEFADVAVWARELPRPTVPAAPWPIAALYGAGAQWLAMTLMSGAISILFLFVRPPQVQVNEVVRMDLPIREAMTSLAAVIAVAVARRAGGWRAVVGLAALFVAVAAAGFAIRFNDCYRWPTVPLGGWCPPALAGYAAEHVPQVVGGIFGIFVAPVFRIRGDGPSAVLLGGAVLVVGAGAIRALIAPFGPIGPDAYPLIALTQVAHMVVWSTARIVVGVLGGGRWAVAALGAAAVLPAVFPMYQWVTLGRPEANGLEWLTFAPLWSAALVVLGWLVGASTPVRSLRRRIGAGSDLAG